MAEGADRERRYRQACFDAPALLNRSVAQPTNPTVERYKAARAAHPSPNAEAALQEALLADPAATVNAIRGSAARHTRIAGGELQPEIDEQANQQAQLVNQFNDVVKQYAELHSMSYNAALREVVAKHPEFRKLRPTLR